MKVLYVEWEDICSYQGWHDADKNHTPLLCRSVGMMHKETKNTITLIQSQGQNGSIAEALTIPKKNIKKRKVIARVPS